MLTNKQAFLLGSFLRDRGVLNADLLRNFTQAEHEEGALIEMILQQPDVTPALIASTFSSAYALEQTALEESEVNARAITQAPKQFILANRIIPFALNGNRLSVALSEPENINKVPQLGLITEMEIEAFVCPIDAMDSWLEYVEGSTVHEEQRAMLSEAMHIEEDDEEDELAEEAGSSEVILYVNELIAVAIEKHVSDIHFEIFKKKARLRYRMDGVLHKQRDREQFLLEHYSAVITRVKIMAKLDIAERRLPQDGAITFKTIEGKEVDLRVSVLPTSSGERVVMRLLDHSAFELKLETLGFLEDDEKSLKQAVDAPQGMVLVTGPTGSGKSTTLYACLNRINAEGINILTAEDPVEYIMEGVGQVQIKDHIGLTFSSALRSFLRQDPEVILVGEIRDKDTGDIAIKAALTGHLVLSTLHTNDAISTVTRLINMGMPPYLVVAALSLVVGQRLSRKNCSECKEIDDIPHELLIDIGLSEAEVSHTQVYKGKGCRACNGTGYKGRQGIYEILKMTPLLKQAILAGKDTKDLLDIAKEEGFSTMQDVGLGYVRSGIMSVAEYQRVLSFAG